MITVDREGLQTFERMAEKMCNEYCYFAINVNSESVLALHCQECPINKILADELTIDTLEEGR